jgi:ABC-type transport system involved in multi-copper enzyme maturation permease subunit
MKFREIFRFEFAYQIRRPWPWLIFATLLVFLFFFVRVNYIADALYAEFALNSPFLIAGATVFGGLLWLLGAAAIAGEAAARDIATRIHPLTYTAPLSKADYFGGRFLAAFTLNALILLAVPLGILLAFYAPGVDDGLIGPFRPAAYLTAYFFISLPNAFIATAFQFSLALRTGRPIAAYLGSLLLIFMAFFVASVLLFRRGMGSFLDPIGIRFIVEDLAHSWTTVEQSTRLIKLEGNILINRLLWSGIALGVLTLTFVNFRFQHRVMRSWWDRLLRGRKTPATSTAGDSIADNKPIAVPEVALQAGSAMQLRKTFAIAWASFRTMAMSWAGLGFLIGLPLLSIPIVIDQMVSGGVQLLPKTARVISELTVSLSDELSRWVIVPLLLIFFAGELVWRERDARLDEISDTMPGSEWIPLLAKFLGLGLMLVVFLGLQTLAGMTAQTLMDYHYFEPDLYLNILFGLQLPEYLLSALLTLVVHVVVNQKYIGYLVATLAHVCIALSPMFGIEHKLLIYGAGPAWSYTEMSGFGASLGPWLWFKLYWVAWAVLLAVVAKLFWVRGREKGLRLRLRLAGHRWRGSTLGVSLIAAVSIVLLGGFIFYNTNILNTYRSSTAIKSLKARYEKQFGKFEDAPQPQIVDTRLHIEIYPDQRQVEIQGTYQLENLSEIVIDTILLAGSSAVETTAISLDQAATLLLEDPALGQRLYALKKPLQPGDRLLLDFQVSYAPQGFRIGGVDAAVVPNGSYFTNDWLPTLGYQPGRELMSPADRRRYGLPSRPLIASLYDEKARTERSPGTSFAAVIGTSTDQVAVAPGALRQSWTKGDRRYFQYATDVPISESLFFFSARYAVHEASWTDTTDASGQTVDIKIFHHPKHRAQLERMEQGIKASLDYYTDQFGAYRYDHVYFVEYPGDGDGTGIHAAPAMLLYEEGFNFLKVNNDPESLDHPFAVIGHEMAHQWTVPYANVEGAPVMSESVAWYYAMKMVEHAKGEEQLDQLRSFMRRTRTPIRRGEPLLRGLDPYLSYRKGPFALYTLSQYAGDIAVNTALRRMLEKHRPPEAPLATTLDLYAELKSKTPDSLQYLLHDLLEINTYWDLQTEAATATKQQDGSWEVTLDLNVQKTVVDSAGVEKEVPMNDWVELGVFLDDSDSGQSDKQLYLEKRRLHSGTQTIYLMVPTRPTRAGLDPNTLLTDLKPEDNLQNVSIKD